MKHSIMIRYLITVLIDCQIDMYHRSLVCACAMYAHARACICVRVDTFMYIYTQVARICQDIRTTSHEWYISNIQVWQFLIN